MAKDFVYRAEYSLSDRSTCKRCRKIISKNTLRLCIMAQSTYHDGTEAQWYHAKCFFELKPNVKVDEIGNFYELRWKDQARVRQLAQGKTTKLPESDSSAEEEEEPEEDDPKGKGKRAAKPGPSNVKKAKKGPVEDPHTAALHAQTDDLWACRSELKKLTNSALKAILTANDQGVPIASKMVDNLADMFVFGAPAKCSVCSSPTGHLVFGSDAYYCQGSVSEWAKCDFNTQNPVRKATVIPADLLKPCRSLQKYTENDPRERVYPLCFQLNVEKVTTPAGNTDGPGEQIATAPTTVDEPSTPSDKPAASTEQPKIRKFDAKLPLKRLKFAAAGTLAMTRAEMTSAIAALGGKLVAKVDVDTYVLITDAATANYNVTASKLARQHDVHVVPVEFITECQDGKITSHEQLDELVERLKLNTWCSKSFQERMRPKEIVNDPNALTSSEQHRATEEWRRQFLVKSGDDRAKVLVTNGAALDPASRLNAKTHSVLREDKMVYAYVLAMTNVADGANSFYKMQVVKRDGQEMYHLFRSWGRIGTVIGGSKCEAMSRADAIQQFEYHFKDKTGNEWRDREQFVKKPGKYFIMELDYGPEEEEAKPGIEPGSKTTLPLPVQDVLRMVFDVDAMRKTMKTFEIDMKKMPLGKVSRKQVLEAMSVLTEVQGLTEAGERGDSPRIIGATNRFFTLIPHDFGVQTPPILNDTKLVKDKLEMLENLLEIELAFSMLRTEDSNSTEDPLDQHYEKLKCSMDVMDKEAPEYKQICEYVQNTHAATHTKYKLEVVDVFPVRRQGETDRFEKYRSLHNHKLLWHGSRTTNFAGILSQGLRIAPPEAPPTGYMFGKGVYFADMVTKSANYCFTNSADPYGLMLLSDVALGNMFELTGSQYIDKLEPNFHSVKGCGRTHPDPKEAIVLPDGVELPLGHSQQTDKLGSSLLYNEYIVYDEAQVNLRYLLKVKFNYAR